jgi:hypothetical protein
VTAGNAITVNYDDPNDTLTIGVNESALSFYDGTNLTADVDNQSVTTNKSTVETGPILRRGGKWQSGFDGADADARLDTVLSQVTDGDVILLEDATYNDDRTISAAVAILGRAGPFIRNRQVQADWTFTDQAFVSGISFDTGFALTFDGTLSDAEFIARANIQVDADGCGVYNSSGVDVTFASGTSDGIADGLKSGSTVTDNGSNTVGDIA